MRRSSAIALIALALGGAPAAGQLLDATLVPRGRLRLQAHPSFTAWDSRFGVAPDGTEREEELGGDLTDPTGLSIYPGASAMIGAVESIIGAPYAPTLGDARGRVTQDVTRIDFGGHVGVFDWLTVGVVVPWMQTRTAVDLFFAPDSAGGSDLGISPAVTSGSSVQSYLTGLEGAASAAAANATTACAGGASATCTSAQALADRATALFGSAGAAYGASPFFPMTGSAAATALATVSSGLDADLMAAGLSGIGATMPFATEVVGSDEFRALAATAGAGIEAFPLRTRRDLWRTGDVEVSALVRLLERRARRAEGGEEIRGLTYRLTGGVLWRLPTGTPPQPDNALDVGTGDGQTDVEGRVIAMLAFGPIRLSAGALYGVQSETTLTRRVVPPEVVVAPLSTRRSVRWSPGSYVSLEIEPAIRVTDDLSLVGVARYFEKRRDEFALVEPDPGLDATVLALESGVKLTQVGGGLRYSTVASWRDGVATRPLELHVRLMRARSGSGGHTPVTTRVEAGVRLFRRFWGPEPPTR
jgi:hypothetical protein